MPKRPDPDPSRDLHLMMRETLLAKLTLHLFSDLEGRIPKGRLKDFFEERTREFFDWERLDLSPYGYPSGYFISGPPEMIAAVRQTLANRS